MFFALAANDRVAFDNILDWTQNNLAQGSLKERLPAWLWGKKENSKWEVLDSNSASDGDVWMACRCWRRGVWGKSSVIPTSAARC